LAGEITAFVDSKAFIEALVNDVSSILPDAEKLPIIVQADSAVLTSTAAITLGALLIELITNATKHAFRSGDQGTLVVRFSDVPGKSQFVLVVEDNGVGIVEQQDSKGFGIQSVTELVRLMHGTATREAARPSETRPGTRWQLVFPREALVSPQP
jgi:two-component sensor histidine kinase